MINELKKTINEYFTGKEEVVSDVLTCFFAGGHVLLEDVPGVGKTTLARILSRAVNLSFGRIQFTPDTLPGDVTGMSVYNMKTGDFEYKSGAVMCGILLADEINRTSPKTRAALLEAMAEGHVTVDGTVYPLPQPFFVIATQNPSGFIGTYPLPEAQLDRFMMRLSVGYPSEEAELKLVRDQIEGKTYEKVDPVMEQQDVLKIREEVAKVHVSDAVLSYMRKIVASTRNDERILCGASPRSLIHLTQAARARAYLSEQDFVRPDDVKAVASKVLAHRIMLTANAKLQKEDAPAIITGILRKTEVPME